MVTHILTWVILIVRNIKSVRNTNTIIVAVSLKQRVKNPWGE